MYVAFHARIILQGYIQTNIPHVLSCTVIRNCSFGTLLQVQEFIVNKDPTLLDNFLDVSNNIDKLPFYI